MHILQLAIMIWMYLGGHLFEMEVAAVGEFILHVFNQETHREIDDDIGLATLKLCKI